MTSPHSTKASAMPKENRYKSSRSTMGRQPLKRFTIAISGYFGEQRSMEQIRKWVHVNGGTVAHDVSSEVTHLVCSKKDFKRDVAMVRKARRLRNVKIVSWDWLEDTLMNDRPMKERDYLLAPLITCAKEERDRKKAIRRLNIQKGMENFEKGCNEFKDAMFSDGYHLYRDPTTSFTYDITLARTNLLINKNDRYALKVCHLPPLSPTSNSKHHHPTPTILTTPLFPTVPLTPRPHARIRTPRAQRLQLFESHATPKYYACFARFSSPRQRQRQRQEMAKGTEEGEEAAGKREETVEMLAPVGSSWETAWGTWRGFFRLKTGRGWEEKGGEKKKGKGKEGGTEEKEKEEGEGFVYAGPKGGMPRVVGMEV